MRKDIKLVGITRVRNESAIIQATLDHVANLVDCIVVYDDCSTDDTPDICEKHPAVHTVIRGKKWASDPAGRHRAEGALRQHAYMHAMKYCGAEYVYYFDADEYADFEGIDFTHDVYRLRLFDFYITPEDVDDHYLDRQWMGPEYRDIKMIFRVTPRLLFKQREPVRHGPSVKTAGWVKHYGKAISVEQWEETCDYYVKHRGGSFRPFFTKKWQGRKGKAIHTKSDYGQELIKWEDRRDKGIVNKF